MRKITLVILVAVVLALFAVASVGAAYQTRLPYTPASPSWWHGDFLGNYYFKGELISLYQEGGRCDILYAVDNRGQVPWSGSGCPIPGEMRKV